MDTVAAFPKTKADEALAILDDAWAYYTPEPLKTDDALLTRDAETFEGYYEAA